MLKRILILLTTICLSTTLALAVQTAEPGTIRNDCPGSVHAQAQMLKDLGLFKGTGKGFELEKPLTRAEVAVMVTRLLGAEAGAKTENNSHPFRDVPAWASPYVGWLYQNGVTKGVSGTEYGSGRNVTCQQFGVFLTRASYEPSARQALTDYGKKHGVDFFEANAITVGDETAACDKAGFLRADAVAMAVRLLDSSFVEGVDGEGNVIADVSVAQALIERGVFTREQFKEAAWEVLEPAYFASTADGRRSEKESDYTLACVMSGVPVLRTGDSSLHYVYTGDGPTQLYAARDNGGLFVVDPDTLALTTLGSGWGTSGFTYFGTIGQTDCFFIKNETYDVLTVTGTDCKRLGLTVAEPVAKPDGKGGYLLDCAGAVCRLDAEGLHTAKAPTENSRLTHQTELFDVYEDVTAERTILSVTEKDGTLLGSYTVENDYKGDLFYAPKVEGVKNNVLWGGVGYYQVTNGKLIQRVARPVYDFGTIWSDNSMVVVTHEPGVRVTYDGGRGAPPQRSGDRLVRVALDGTETVVLSGTEGPFGPLVLGKVTEAADGRIAFTVLVPTEPFMTGAFTCVLERGRVTVKDQTGDIAFWYGEDAAQKAETWLNAGK